MQNNREAKIKRHTKETDIELVLQLDGTGESEISTGVGFFDHMLTHLAKHSRWNLIVRAKGDLHVDAHHTVEDVGLCIGAALKDALGDKGGVRRFACSSVPMDETLANVAVDISGRPMLVYNVRYPTDKVGEFDVQLVEEFFRAIVNTAGLTLHINVSYGDNSRHIAEAIFKASAQALGQATQVIDDINRIPSTKGVL